MGKKLTFLAALAVSAVAMAAQGQQAPPAGGANGPGRAGPTGPVKSAKFHTTYVRLGGNSFDGLLYEPDEAGPKARIALVMGFGTYNFQYDNAAEMANRGYRVMLVRHYGEDHLPYGGVPELSRGITYLRTLPGVQKVVVVGHSGGSRLSTIYVSLAQNGPAACQKPGVIYPCKDSDATGLAKPDGVVLLDPAIASTSNTSTSFDPAYDEKGKRTIKALDMYDPANGYDPKTGSARYSPDFIKRFYAAQSARNMKFVNAALARLKVIEAGKGQFTDDEPFIIPGAIEGGNGARLFHTDLSLQEHTKTPHILLKADGSAPEVIIHNVRPPTGIQDQRAIGSMAKGGAINTTVREFLANFATRTTPDYALTADDVIGIDWNSGNKQAPGMAEGVTVPALVMANTCFYLMVHGEVLYDHLASKDKIYVGVEGAAHNFNACKPEYGDTAKRTFDYVDGWLQKPGRF